MMIFLCFVFCGLHVDGDMSSAAIPLFEFMLNGGGALVSIFKGQSAVHAHVGLDGNVVANTACTQVMGLKHTGKRLDNSLYLAFSLSRE